MVDKHSPYRLVLISSLVALALLIAVVFNIGIDNQGRECTYATTITVTTTETVTTTVGEGRIGIEILSSRGMCDSQEAPSLSIIRKDSIGGEYFVVLSYREPTNDPCYTHTLADTIILEKYPPIVKINLKLERTADVCVKCLGVVETLIKIGPIPEGTEIEIGEVMVRV